MTIDQKKVPSFLAQEMDTVVSGCLFSISSCCFLSTTTTTKKKGTKEEEEGDDGVMKWVTTTEAKEARNRKARRKDKG